MRVLEECRWRLVLPNEGKGNQLLKVKGEVGSEGGLKEHRYGLLIFEPDRSQAEEKGSTHSTKEPSPVVADSKVGSGHLNTEQHTCRTQQC